MLTILQYIIILIICLTGSFIGITKLTQPVAIFWSGVITLALAMIILGIFEYIKDGLYEKRTGKLKR